MPHSYGVNEGLGDSDIEDAGLHFGANTDRGVVSRTSENTQETPTNREPNFDFGDAFSTGADRRREPCPGPHAWCWDMTLVERWEACQDLMFQHKEMLGRLMGEAKEHLPLARKALQNATVRASARVFENRTVIGGTIVGCIARLEAIRATAPFAIIVEEASEVLEPLLSWGKPIK